MEAWQNKKHSKENTSENLIPRQEIFKPVDHVKYEGQVRSGQVTTFLFCAVFSLSFQAIVLLTKLLEIIIRGLFDKSEMSGRI